MEPQNDQSKARSPLTEYGHDVVVPVDLFVMFVFGLVNAGVDLNGFGPYTAVIFLSLLIGKTLGIGLFATAMVKAGYPLPSAPQFTLRGAWLVGLINSVGLTVALFVSGEAYRNDPVLQAEAKLGALLSVCGCAFTLITAKIVGIDAYDPEYEARLEVGSPAGRKSSEFERDEDLQHHVAKDVLDHLASMDNRVKSVEKEAHITRAQAVEASHQFSRSNTPKETSA